MEQIQEYPLKSVWVFWENLKQIQSKSSQQKESEFMDNNKEIIKVQDLQTFSQFWNNSKFSKPFSIFMDLEGQITRVKIDEVFRQIEALAVFRDNVKPAWEDPLNVKGSEFRQTLIVKTPEDVKLIEKSWEQSVIHLIADENNEIMQSVTGIRMADKSMAKNAIKIRFEYWMNLNYENPDDIEKMDIIKDLLQKMYGKILNTTPQAVNLAYFSHITEKK